MGDFAPICPGFALPQKQASALGRVENAKKMGFSLGAGGFQGFLRKKWVLTWGGWFSGVFAKKVGSHLGRVFSSGFAKKWGSHLGRGLAYKLLAYKNLRAGVF